MAGRNPHYKYNTWSQPGKTDNYQTHYLLEEDNPISSSFTLDSLDEASTLDQRNDSQSDSLMGSFDDEECEATENESEKGIIFNKADHFQGFDEAGKNAVIDRSTRDVPVPDIYVELRQNAEGKESETLVDRAYSSSPNRVETNTDSLGNIRGDLRPESIAYCTPTLKETKKEIKRIQSTGGSVFQMNRSEDVFLLYLPDGKTSADILCSEFKENSIKWCDYENGFNPSHSMLYDLSMFLFSCKRTVVILSPGFYKSKLFMYFLQTTVKYCVDHGKSALIPVLTKTKPSEIPIWLNVFPYFQTDHPNWTKNLIEALAAKVQPLKDKVVGNPLCNEQFGTVNSIKSEPPNLKLELSNSTKKEMKIWLRTKFGHLPQEFQNSSDAYENEDIEIIEEESTERGVNSEIRFADQLRRESKKVYDSVETFCVEDFDVAAGDILEICETCEDGKRVRVKNSRAQTTIMPMEKLLPNVFLLPMAAVEMVKHPATKEENANFEKELRSNGIDVLTAVDSSTVNSQTKFQTNDIFAKINKSGRYIKVKNCRNEILHLKSLQLKEKVNALNEDLK